MTYKLVVSARAEKSIKKIPSKFRKKVWETIYSLTEQPIQPHKTVKMKGDTGEPLYRIRQGDYRIVYKVEHHTVTIVVTKVAHRKDVYAKKNKS